MYSWSIDVCENSLGWCVIWKCMCHVLFICKSKDSTEHKETLRSRLQRQWQNTHFIFCVFTEKVEFKAPHGGSHRMFLWSSIFKVCAFSCSVYVDVHSLSRAFHVKNNPYDIKAREFMWLSVCCILTVQIQGSPALIMTTNSLNTFNSKAFPCTHSGGHIQLFSALIKY